MLSLGQYNTREIRNFCFDLLRFSFLIFLHQEIEECPNFEDTEIFKREIDEATRRVQFILQRLWAIFERRNRHLAR